MGQSENHSSKFVKLAILGMNAPNEDNLTPLHHAVAHNDIEAVSQLLYHEVDVTLVDGRNFSPFLHAVLIFNLPAVVLLWNYYEHLYPRFTYGYYEDILDIRSSYENPITHNKKFMNFMSQMWGKLDQHLVESDRKLFLENYPKEYNSTRSGMLRQSCFFILEFTFPFYLPQDCSKFKFSHFFELCEQRDIGHRTRMGLIWTWLTLGAEVLLKDIELAFKLYGYSGEVEALVSISRSPLLALLLSLEESSSEMVFQKYLSRGLESPIFHHNTMYKRAVDVIETMLNFFALSWRMKEELLRKWRIFDIDETKILVKLAKLPEIPLLKELSRNHTMKLFKKHFAITNVEEYENIVRDLHVPEEVKNLILFNKPLYG